MCFQNPTSALTRLCSPLPGWKNRLRPPIQLIAANMANMRRDHIMLILRQLHWLPVRQRVTFKIAVLVCQCLTGQAPAYLADDCQLSTRRLRSTDTATCVVRRSNNSFGDRCFAAAGPRLYGVWNMLPIYLRLCDSLGQFKRMLKTHLFGAWDRGALLRFS